MFVGSMIEGLSPVTFFRLGMEGTNRNAYDTPGNCIGAVAFEFSL